MVDLIVTYDSAFGFEIEPGAIPTPALVQAGRGEAYFVANDGPSKDRIPGIWYLRDDKHGYVSPDGQYKRVRVIRRESRY